MPMKTPPDAVLEWLLEPDNPPVRYLTLVHLLGRSTTDQEVDEARRQLNAYGPTQAILAQIEEFRDDNHATAYWKYKGLYWQVIFLGQLHADGRDPRIRQLAERLIEERNWVLIPSGGQCLTANVLSSLHSLGYGGHPVVQEATVKLAERTVNDGGIDCEVMEYSLLPFCYMAQPKLLLCFAAAGELGRHPSVIAATDLLRTSLLAHQVHVYVPGNRAQWLKVLEKQPGKPELAGRTVRSWRAEEKKRFLSDKGLGRPDEKPGWLKFGFPLHYNSDLLEAVHALALHGTPYSEPLEKPLGIIREKMTPDGKWVMASSLNGKMRADVEKKGCPSKWLTFRAWHVLQHFTPGPLQELDQLVTGGGPDDNRVVRRR